MSTAMGFGIGYFVTKLIGYICKDIDRRKTTRFFKNAQVTGGADMAFMHGAQDGQKFMGVFMLGVFLAKGQGNVTSFEIPLWLMLLLSIVMALGTSIGGYRIIKTVGMGMVKIRYISRFCFRCFCCHQLISCIRRRYPS